MTQIIEEIAKLSRAEQAYIAHYILDALANNNENDLTTPQLAAVTERAAAIKDGSAVTYDWQEVQNEINQKHGFNATLPQRG